MTTSSDAPLRLHYSADGTLALLDILPQSNDPGRSLSCSDLIALMLSHGHYGGFSIESTACLIQEARRTKKPITNIVLAGKPTAQQGLCYIGEDTAPAEPEQLVSFFQAALWLNSNAPSVALPSHIRSCMFVRKGDSILKLNMPCPTSDNTSEEDCVFKAGDGVTTTNSRTHMVFIASASGYIGCSDEGRLTVIKPIFASPDKMKLYFNFLPVSHGSKKQIDCVLDAMCEAEGTEGQGIPPSTVREYCQRKAAHKAQDFIQLKSGIPAFSGSCGAIEWKIELKQKPHPASHNDSVDFFDLCPFAEVQEGQLIAIYTKPIAPRNGYDVFGKEIHAQGVDKIPPLCSSENIIIDDSACHINYYAACDGIARISGNTLSISKALIVASDADIKTGNINYSKDIVIYGSVQSCITVNAGRDLIVYGSIENGATVHCGGSLKVHKAIIGKKTIVEAKGNIDAGYIIESTVQAIGDIQVTYYIKNSHVTSEGFIKVIGRNHKSYSRGAIINGRLTAVKGIEAHSVGTRYALTKLAIGADTAIDDQVEKGEKLLATLTTRMLQIQNELPLGLDLLELSMRQSEAERKSLKINLLKLKKIAGQRERLLLLLEELKGNKAEKNCVEIMIANRVIPDVLIQINRHELLVKNERQHVRIFYVNNKICINSI